LEPFTTIGRELSECWARVNFDEQQFPALAVAALEAARVHERVGQREVLEWLATTAHLPRQGALGFGQPPVNLYRDEHGNALGVDLDAEGFWVLERMLAGTPEAQIVAEAKRAGGAVTPTKIAQLCFMLPWNSVLGPLLDASPG
jgi:hypothetical protein